MDNIKKFTAEENADRFFTKYPTESCKNDSQMLSSTQYHERLTETFKEYEKEIETLSNVCDSERAKIERLKTVGSEMAEELKSVKKENEELSHKVMVEMPILCAKIEEAKEIYEDFKEALLLLEWYHTSELKLENPIYRSGDLIRKYKSKINHE